MTAKEYLREVWVLRCLMKSEEERLKEVYQTVDGIKAIRYDIDRVQASPSEPMADGIAGLIEAEKKYTRAAVRYHKAVQERSAMIRKLDDPRHIAVLYGRYLDCKSWDDIADSLGYTRRHVLRIHGRALLAFSNKHQNRLKRLKRSTT